jgi:hypothetical protein
MNPGNRDWSGDARYSPGPGKEIVGAKDLVTLVEQPVDKMGAEKTGAAGHQNPFA